MRGQTDLKAQADPVDFAAPGDGDIRGGAAGTRRSGEDMAGAEGLIGSLLSFDGGARHEFLIGKIRHMV